MRDLVDEGCDYRLKSLLEGIVWQGLDDYMLELLELVYHRNDKFF
jgi:hypothetical protein